MDEQIIEKRLKSKISFAIVLSPILFIILFLISGCFCISIVGLSSGSCSPNIFCKILGFLAMASVIVAYFPFFLIALIEKSHIQFGGVVNIIFIVIAAILSVVWIYYLTKLIYFLINKFKK